MTDLGISIQIEGDGYTPANGQEGLLTTARSFNVLPQATQNETDNGKTLITLSDQGLPPPPLVYYKMRGYYSISSNHETWISVGIADTNPPSGNPLSNIIVVQSWIA